MLYSAVNQAWENDCTGFQGWVLDSRYVSPLFGLWSLKGYNKKQLEYPWWEVLGWSGREVKLIYSFLCIKSWYGTQNPDNLGVKILSTLTTGIVVLYKLTCQPGLKMVGSRQQVSMRCGLEQDTVVKGLWAICQLRLCWLLWHFYGPL